MNFVDGDSHSGMSLDHLTTCKQLEQYISSSLGWIQASPKCNRPFFQQSGYRLAKWAGERGISQTLLICARDGSVVFDGGCAQGTGAMEVWSAPISSESVPRVMLLPFCWTALMAGGFQELHNCCQNASKTSAVIVFFSFTPGWAKHANFVSCNHQTTRLVVCSAECKYLVTSAMQICPIHFLKFRCNECPFNKQCLPRRLCVGVRHSSD